MKILTELDEKILCDIFDMDLKEGLNVSSIDYGLRDDTGRYSSLQALYSHLSKLERLNYLEIEYNKDGAYCLTGGWKHPKYNNNVISISNDKIHVSDKGILYVCEFRKTTMDRIKGAFKSFLSSFLKELRSQVFKIVISFILGTLFGSYGISLIKSLFKGLSK